MPGSGGRGAAPAGSGSWGTSAFFSSIINDRWRSAVPRFGIGSAEEESHEARENPDGLSEGGRAARVRAGGDGAGGHQRGGAVDRSAGRGRRGDRTAGG